MTSALTMTTGRRQSSKFRRDDDFQFSPGYSGSPLFQSNESIDMNDSTNIGHDNNNSRSASSFLSKLIDKDIFNDLEASPSPTCQDSDSFMTYKTPSRLSMQKIPPSQRKMNRPTIVRHKPAEVFRKDLISAMKIPDTSQLLSEEYWVMQDPWRIEWEKGVQVPVNQKGLPVTTVRTIQKETQGGFRMPKKMLKSSPEPGDKDMVDLNVLADTACRYDLDEMDVNWLNENNEERKMMGLSALDEFSMEQIMEELETQCHDNMQMAIQTKEGLGIEYDEDVVCDVCRMPDCEEGNEMVFCDGCNLCVHQACYGILKVPEGNWLCRLCSLGIRGSAVCILCDQKGGAMKSTRSGNKWAHVSCALWIPEISIADPERMEPITKVSHVPASRWALLCSICKERVGACIQCSVKHCVTAYHVTCAIEEKLDMTADCSDETAEDAVIFRSYCKKHSKNRKESVGSREKDEEERRNLRQKRIMELEEEFFTLVKDEAVANALSVPVETVQEIMSYWKLKRRSNFNRPLITPKHEEDTALAEAAESNLQRRLRMFTHLRQDLERVRNLCYMIGRREKTKRMSVKNMESVFLTQMKILERKMCSDPSFKTQKVAAFLTKFGQPEVCELSKRESLVLAKCPEWMPPDVLAKEHKVVDVGVKSFRRKKSEIAGNKSVAKDDKENPDVDSNLKNGLHRKAFLSACERREALGLKRTSSQPQSDDFMEIGSNVVKPRPVGRPRKRIRKSASISDQEIENDPKATQSEITKKLKVWPPWRTKHAGASPSAFTVKTKTVEDTPNSESDGNRTPRLRSTRLGSKFHASSKTETPGERLIADTEEYTVTKTSPKQVEEPENHLVIKWDSDKIDEPEIRTRPNRKSSITEPSVKDEKTRKSSNGEVSLPTLKSPRLSQKDKKPESPVNTPYRSLRSQPKRKASSKAKNDSGALASSCDEKNVKMEEGSDASSSVQELRGQSQYHEEENKMQKLEDNQKEEEDGGYRGDMDESDIEHSGRRLRKHKHHLGKRALHILQRQQSDTAESSDSVFVDKDRPVLMKRRRLRSIYNRQQQQHPESSEIKFQGFKDGLDEEKSSSLHSSSQYEVTRALSQTTETKNIVSKNEVAVGDAFVKSSQENKHPNIADGQFLFPARYNQAEQSQRMLPHAMETYPAFHKEQIHNPYYSRCYTNYPYMPPQPNYFYPSVYPGQGWTLTPKQESIYAQQFSAHSLKSTYPRAPTVAPTLDVSSPPPLPDSTVSPESKLVPPVFTESTEAPTLLSQTGGQDPHPRRKSHKKKKKKKHKKKKKKRKRSIQSLSESNTSEHSGSSDEYCVEYCSTLDPQMNEQTPKEQVLDNILNADNPVPSHTVELSQSGNDAQNSSNTSYISIEDRTPVKVPGLLLKIDKKRLALPTSFEEESASSSASEEEQNLPIQEENVPSVSPLKLKLSFQKSDRALRSGLMPCVYTIMDDEPEVQSKTEEKDDAQTEASDVAPTRGKAALRRLGLLGTSKDVASKASKPETDNKARRQQVGRTIRKRQGQQQAKNLQQNLTLDNQISLQDEKQTLLMPEPLPASTSTPCRTRSTSDVTLPDTTSPPTTSSSSSFTQQRHWKKRKVQEHETSVTSDFKSVTVVPHEVPVTADTKTAIETPHEVPVTTDPKTTLEAPHDVTADQKTAFITQNKTSNSSNPPTDVIHNSNTSMEPHGPNFSASTSKPELLPETTVPDINPVPKSSSTPLKPETATVISRSVANSTLPAAAANKPARKKSSADQTVRKNSGKNSSQIDGLPPVSPYRFTISNTHQQKKCKAPGSTSETIPDKTSAINKILARQKKLQNPQMKTQSKPSKEDPYEFADFGT